MYINIYHFNGSHAFFVFFRNKKEAAIALEKKRIIGKAKIGGRFDLIGRNQTFFIFLLTKYFSVKNI